MKYQTIKTLLSLNGFIETEADFYAIHSKERVIFWDENRKQHFFISQENKVSNDSPSLDLIDNNSPDTSSQEITKVNQNSVTESDVDGCSSTSANDTKIPDNLINLNDYVELFDENGKSHFQQE